MRGIARTIVSFEGEESEREKERDSLARALFRQKQNGETVRSRHPTPKFRRKAITDDDDGDALSEEHRWRYNSVTYVRTRVYSV